MLHEYAFLLLISLHERVLDSYANLYFYEYSYEEMQPKQRFVSTVKSRNEYAIPLIFSSLSGRIFKFLINT